MDLDFLQQDAFDREVLMRVLAIDLGEKRCGLAVSDVRQCIATPVDVVPLAEAVNNTGTFAAVLNEYEPELLVCGLPVSLSGEEGRQARRIRAIAGQITKSCGIPHVFADERLSSVSARGALREMGYDDKRMKGKIDMVAASMFLQSWLDSNSDLGVIDTTVDAKPGAAE